METQSMTPRERLQFVYELAFFPPSIHCFWREISTSDDFDKTVIRQLLADALSLHLALPEKGFQSQRALKRVAGYQASAKAFGTESFIKNIGEHLGLDILPGTDKISPGMIRDLKLPEFSHKKMTK
jgi:hypothetical protein